MRRTSIRFAYASLILFAGFVAQPANSASGGSGGGGGMPSETAPQFDPAVEYQKGIAAYQAGDYKNAANAFKRVVGVVPTHAPAQYLLGSSYLQLGDFKKAKGPLENAVKRDGKMVEALRDLGVTYAKLQIPAKATAQRDALAKLKTDCGTACESGAKIDEAIKAVEAAMAGTPQALAPMRNLAPLASVDAVYVEAVGLINVGHYDQAIGKLEQSLWAAGPHPDLMTYLGFANRKLKRYDAARTWYEAALAAAPNHRGALEYYGELKLELGDVAGAQRHLVRLDRLCGFGCQQADELRRWLRESGKSVS